jgi:hypothetical protein
VISVLALFVALGGTSYAVTQLPKNSVGTPQLKKNAVTGTKVKDGSLTGADVDVATLGTVPIATSANRADSAGSANRATTAGSADRATTAGSATTAERATTAGSATSATTATRADSAASADTATTAATAANATNAVNATNAANATNATNAANAADSALLNGQTAAQLAAASKVQCPAGTKPAAGACLDELPNAAAPLYGAFQACGEGNRRLPTTGELIAYVQQYVAADSSLEEWVEPEIIYEGGFKGMYIAASKAEYAAYVSEPSFGRAYRCATAASN